MRLRANGIIIQNSFPKGGPYAGSINKNYNYSYLVFFTRLINETGTPLDLTVNFSADSIERNVQPADAFPELPTRCEDYVVRAFDPDSFLNWPSKCRPQAGDIVEAK